MFFFFFQNNYTDSSENFFHCFMPTCFLRVQTGVNNFSPLSVPLRLFCNLSEVPHEHGSKGNLTPCRNRQQNHQPEIKGSCILWKNKINKLLCAREFPVCGRILARFFLQQSVCAVLNLALCSEQTTKPKSQNSNSPCILPEGLGHNIGTQKKQIVITHIVCMQHSEELRIGDKLHSWRLQQ